MNFPKPLFFIFIFFIPFEIYKLRLGNLISLRSYQAVAVLLLIFLAYFYFKGKIKTEELFAIFRSPISKLLAVYFIVSLISLINSPDIKNGIQETLVLLSFLTIYWLVLFFVRTEKDVRNIFYIIIASGTVAALIGLVQVAAYKFGLGLIEVMPGRPNSILPEPDWLGFFMVFALAVLIAVQYFESFDVKLFWVKILRNKYFYYGINVLFYIVIILTIARASWLAGIGMVGLYLFLIFIDKNNPFGQVFVQGFKILFFLFLGLAVIYIFSLTPFSLKNRFLSIVTSQETHAIAVDPKTGKEVSIEKKKIVDYKKQGIEVKEKKVQDINILIRRESFTDNFDIILKHPFLGIGFGGIETAFGNGINANNIFMEVWIGSGIVGLIIFVLIFYCVFREWLFYYIKKRTGENKAYLYFIILGLVAVIIPNIFNSGLFLGFFWVYLGIASNLLDHQLYG